MTDPSTPVPSDEAFAAADRVLTRSGHAGPSGGAVAAALTAAYAIDAPRIAAEARAATLAAVEAWLEAREVGTARIADFHRTFNAEANADDA